MHCRPFMANPLPVRAFFFVMTLLPGILVYGQQQTGVYKLRLQLPLLDLPENTTLPYAYPSMQQSLVWGQNFYDLAFWGIDALGDALIDPAKGESGNLRLILNRSGKYLAGLAFARYGSELPIPLGVWTHEEFHRSVLGINELKPENGNWIFSRWDGTVYGIADEELGQLKEDNLPGLLYSYVSGVHSENLFTREGVTDDFYHARKFYKNPFYLYNAYYVLNYFNFSTSPASDSVKIIAPEHESDDPYGRDFAGSDLTAWALDMFLPEQPYAMRDSFPGGDGLNRRIGFGDLPAEAQDFLLQQKRLAWINFINPAIFMINRIRISEQFSFNFLMQYAPTHFGNDISWVIPFRLHENNFLVSLHAYNNYYHTFWGMDLGIFQRGISRRIELGAVLHGWIQPETQSFFDEQGKPGGGLEINTGFRFSRNLSAHLSLTGKTAGWIMGNPFLEDKLGMRLGLRYSTF